MEEKKFAKKKERRETFSRRGSTFWILSGMRGEKEEKKRKKSRKENLRDFPGEGPRFGFLQKKSGKEKKTQKSSVV